MARIIRPALKFASRIFSSRTQTLPAPYKLVYSVTKECHSRCENCLIWKVTPSNELRLDEVEKLAQNSPYLSWLNLTGGEPTDRKDLVEIVASFLKYNPDLYLVNFPTNGLKTEHIAQTCRRIAELKIPRVVVSVSIDGPPQVNDELRGLKGDFRQAVKTYSELLKIRGVTALVGMTLYEKNYPLVQETVDAIRESIPNFSYRRLHLNIPHVSRHLYENSEKIPITSQNIARAAEEVRKKRGFPRSPLDVLEQRYQSLIAEYLRTARTPIPCQALMSSVYLSETGDVYPCSIWSHKLGNIRDHAYDLLPIIRTEEARLSRELISQKKCPNCWSPCEASQSLLARAIP